MEGNKPEDDNERFSELVKGVVKKAQTETVCEAADTLRDVIRSHIQTWLDQVENIDPLYKVSELIPVGSYAEGTKILQPDEFDCLVVIEEFSKPDMITIDANEQDIQRGLVKVKVKDEELKSKCSGLCKEGHLQCFQPINYAKLGEKRFGHVLIQILWTIIKRSKTLVLATGTPTEMDCKILLPPVNSVPLYFTGAEFSAPNVLIKFEYEAMEVTVDVSPAIRYHKINDCFREKDCAGPAFAELVLSRKSHLLVGTTFKSDFKVTVTEAEVEYIKRVMKPEHKIIYIFLKCIVNLFKTMARINFCFTSYMMKTVCIHHDIKCEMGEGSLKDCFKSVLDDLNVCTQQEYVVSIVNKNIHLTKYPIKKTDMEYLIHGMKRMCLLPRDMIKVEDFDEFLKQIVLEEGQERLKVEREREKENEEYQNSIIAELREKVSRIVAMGYDPEEVQDVMTRYMYDSEQAIHILQKRAKKRAEEKFDKKNGSSMNHEEPNKSSQTKPVCGINDVSERSSNSAHEYQGQDERSGKYQTFNSPLEFSEEILYQRQKDD